MNKKWLERNKRKNQKAIIYVTIIFALIIILMSSVKDYSGNAFSSFVMNSIAPVGKLISSSRVYIVNNVENMIPKDDKSLKIQELEEENENLRNQLIKNTVTESELTQLQELKNTLTYIEEDYEKKYITTSIVAKNDGNYYSSFTIAGGKNQGVEEESIVLSGKGLVGIVYEVSDNYCKAISILNSKASVSFEVLRNNQLTGLASQNIHIDDQEDTEGYINGYMFDMAFKVLPGDVLITSGLGLYPKGIPIGVVDKVIENKSTLLKYVKIKPYVNFQRLEKVMILNPRQMD